MTLPNLNEAQRLALLQGVFQTLDDGALVIDREFTIVLSNAWVEKRMPGGTSAIGRKCYAALFGKTDKCPACPFVRSIQTGAPQRQVMRASSAQDQVEWFELITYPLRDPSGAAAGAIEHVKNISMRKQLEEQVRNEATRGQILLDQSQDGVAVFDLEGRVVEANQQYAHILGYTTDELRQLHIWDWDTQTDRGRLLYMLETAEAVRDRFETSYRRKDGTPVQVEVFTTGGLIGGRTLVFHLCRDITEKKEMQKQVRDIGVRDTLTGIYNGRYIFERLIEFSAEYQRGKGDFCLSVLEVDDFHSAREFHGNRALDQAFKELAGILNHALRPYDLLGRYGGEGFIIVSRNATVAETAPMMERITRVVREKEFTCEGHRMRFTLSSGTAHSSEFPSGTFEIDAMVSRAELRKNEAKALGKGRSVGPPTDGPAVQKAPPSG